jgi:predicted N-acetyltransferase YhbS
VEIRESRGSDNIEIGKLHATAFGEKEGPEIAILVAALMSDGTASPLLSLVAVEENRILGHILFSKAKIRGAPESVSAHILAPLAVVPGDQSTGIGARLIQAGLDRLSASGVDLVFVLGHPDYYPRSGFVPAGALGFEAPYPIPGEHAGAWMVQALRSGVLGRVTGKIQCAAALNRPEYWRE